MRRWTLAIVACAVAAAAAPPTDDANARARTALHALGLQSRGSYTPLPPPAFHTASASTASTATVPVVIRTTNYRSRASGLLYPDGTPLLLTCQGVDASCILQNGGCTVSMDVPVSPTGTYYVATRTPLDPVSGMRYTQLVGVQ